MLRRDVDSYTDSIPIMAGSPLWPMLEEALGKPLHPLIEQVIRVEMKLPGEGLVCRTKGLPMGQPIAAVIANLYLGGLDRALEDIDGGFYARYGDDFLFAHPDADAAQEAAKRSDEQIAELRLTVNEKKKQTFYLTPPGRPSTDWPQAKGSPWIHFLGTHIAADGTVGLDKKKVRLFLREIDRRVGQTVRTRTVFDLERLGPSVCSVVNRAIDPRSALTQQKSGGVAAARRYRPQATRAARLLDRAHGGRDRQRAQGRARLPRRALRHDPRRLGAHLAGRRPQRKAGGRVNELERWFKRQAAREARIVTLEEGLLGGRMWRYAWYRLRYFFATYLVESIAHAVLVLLLFDALAWDNFILVAAAIAVTTLVSQFWWGALEAMRGQVRELHRAGKPHRVPAVIAGWMTLSAVPSGLAL